MDIKKDKIIIIGSGGLASIVIDILKTEPRYNIEGLIDLGGKAKSIGDIKVIGTDSDLPKVLKNGIKMAVVAIGCVSKEENLIRRKKYETIRDMGFEIINVIQKEAYISKTCCIGQGNIIIGQCYIGPYVKIGSGAIIHPFVSIEHHSNIGDYVHFSQGVKIAGNVRVGRLSFIGMGVGVIQGAVIPEEAFIKTASIFPIKN